MNMLHTKFKHWLLIVTVVTMSGCKTVEMATISNKIHSVTDLSHQFTFYADNRFHIQYLSNDKGVTNWCNLYNTDFSNVNLLILLGCDDRIKYFDKDVETINSFLMSGGGVVIFGTQNTNSQNELLKNYGAEFKATAKPPLKPSPHLPQIEIEGKSNSSLFLKNKKKWDMLITDAHNNAVMARRKVGKGTLLVSSRGLAGSNPNASDSINKEIWKPLLRGATSGKVIDPGKSLKGLGIADLEHSEDHGTFKLSYNDYMKPYANAMVEIYKRSLPFIEKRMGVPLSPGMASHITLLATDGGGFSSGTVVALAVWWGGFPEKEDSMIEFLTHESVHSWVLPFPEVWNEPIATYVGNLVMMDMGHEEEAIKRIERTIARASIFDPEMNLYDIRGELTGNGRELDRNEKNEVHWGKTYWIFEQLRKENPDFMAEYFQLKRKYATPSNITKYDMNHTVALLSMVMERDLFEWFNNHGIEVNKKEAVF